MPNLVTWFDHCYRSDIHLWAKYNIGLSPVGDNVSHTKLS